MEKLKISSLDHYGRGISHINEKIVFIKNALVDEEVEINIIKDKKNYCEAVVSQYINQSLLRETPRCPYYNLCGGCHIMHMSYNSQLSFKENKVKEILKKFCNIEHIIKPIIKSENLYYRNKLTLQVNKKLGLYKEESYDIINIDECLICKSSINDIIKKLNKLDLTNINQIIIRANKENNVMICISAISEISEKYFINELKDMCVSIIIKMNNKYKTIYGNNTIIEIVGDYKFNISAESFFQVNTEQAGKMYDLVKSYVGNENETILDLYCGTGTIGIYLSKAAKKVIGVEINKYAIEDAYLNAKLNNVDNIEFICDDVKYLTKEVNTVDVVIIDPPRSGLDTEAINKLLNINPQKIIYVSCDPVTLARDINLLKEKYDVIEVTPLDMFPNTYHVECIVKMKRKS